MFVHILFRSKLAAKHREIPIFCVCCVCVFCVELTYRACTSSLNQLNSGGKMLFKANVEHTRKKNPLKFQLHSIRSEKFHCVIFTICTRPLCAKMKIHELKFYEQLLRFLIAVICVPFAKCSVFLWLERRGIFFFSPLNRKCV